MNPQDNRRRELRDLLGDLPSPDNPPACRTVSVDVADGYVLETLRLDVGGLEEVPAFFARPEDGSARPTVLYNHAHGGAYDVGKDELTRGRGGLQNPPYARALPERGYNVLCIDHWAFGERRGRTESEIFKEMLWRGRVMWGMMLFDSIRALDYLCGREDVDPERIGTMGISMGSTMAWWLAALDVRVRACVDICCMTEFESLIQSRGLDGHGIYYYVPGLLKHFTTADINGLICPRPHLCLAGNYDGLTPPAGLDRVEEALRRRYEEAGRPEAWEMVRYDQGHFENPDMRRRTLEFFERWL